MKKTIAVIFGGDSVEHDISIITGLQTISAIDDKKYEAIPVYLKDGAIYFGESLGHIQAFINFREHKHKKGYFRLGKLYRSIIGLSFPYAKIDCALLCTHGGEGENGALQGYLAYCRIPFTSPDIFQCSLFMDKAHTKQMAKSMDIACLPWRVMYKRDFAGDAQKEIKDLLSEFYFPVIVKPCLLGSSIGIGRAEDEQELLSALELAFMFGEKVIIEPALKDFREINIAVFRGEDNEIILSEPEEPIAGQNFLSFDDKYMGGGKGMAGSRRELPAKISKGLKKKIEEYSRLLYDALECKGVIRIDYLVKEGKIYLNEVNSIPGSLAYYLFSGKDISHSALISSLIDSAIKTYGERECSLKQFRTSVLKNLQTDCAKGTKLPPSQMLDK